MKSEDKLQSHVTSVLDRICIHPHAPITLRPRKELLLRIEYATMYAIIVQFDLVTVTKFDVLREKETE